VAAVQGTRGCLEAARAALDRAHARRPDPMWLLARTMLPPIAGSSDAMSRARQEFAEGLDTFLRDGLTLSTLGAPTLASFYLGYQGVNDRDLLVKLASLYRQACPPLAWTAPHCAGWSRPAGRRLRVGFVSTYFFDHTIGKLSQGLIERLDRRRFEVIVFLAGSRPDGAAAAIAAAADRSVRAPGELVALRSLVADARLDILFYPDIGMDSLTYFLAHARLAPVQAVTWGHPVTTGIPTIDWFVSSAGLEPDNAVEHYSETLVRLDRLPACYHRPSPRARPVSRERLGLPEDVALYVCPQSLFKLHPDFDEVLGAILRRDRRGRLILIEGLSARWGQTLRARLARTVPDACDRVQFLPRLGVR
jgi:predicted O-linked N-acetylglucosamine transferase (SPINDLY family)